LDRFLLETTLRLCGAAHEDDRTTARGPFRYDRGGTGATDERLSGFGVPA